MKREHVPLEQFDLSFNASELEDAKKAKEVIVTALRFLEKDILPGVEEFFHSLPSIHEIESKQIRTSADARHLLHVGHEITIFTSEKERHMDSYLSTAMKSLSPSDGEKVESMIFRRLDKLLAEIKNIQGSIRKKLNDFRSAAKGHTFFPGEGSTIEDAVIEAGEKYNTPLDKLLK